MAVPYSPLRNMRSQSLFLLQRPPLAKCPNLLAVHLVLLLPCQNSNKTWGRPSPRAGISSDDEPLSDKEADAKSKGHKRGYTSPEDVVVVDEDDDEPLPSRKGKTLAKKPKVQYTSGWVQIPMTTPDTWPLSRKRPGATQPKGIW